MRKPRGGVGAREVVELCPGPPVSSECRRRPERRHPRRRGWSQERFDARIGAAGERSMRSTPIAELRPDCGVSRMPHMRSTPRSPVSGRIGVLCRSTSAAAGVLREPGAGATRGSAVSPEPCVNPTGIAGPNGRLDAYSQPLV